MSLRHLFPLTITLLICGCSTTSSNVAATLRYAISGPDDVTVAPEKINQLPYASAYIRVGDNPRAFVVLAFADKDGSLTWVSSDKTVFVTRYGRLIKTRGLANDLYLLKEKTKDPLSEPARLPADPNITYSTEWLAEWSKDYVSGYHITTHLTYAGSEWIQVLDRSLDTLRFEERVEVEHNNTNWVNVYWFDKVTHRLVKTQQHLGYDLDVVEMVVLKSFL